MESMCLQYVHPGNECVRAILTTHKFTSKTILLQVYARVYSVS